MKPPPVPVPLCPVCTSAPAMTPATHTRNIAIFICHGCGSTLSRPIIKPKPEQNGATDDARREATGLVQAVIKDGRIQVPEGVRSVVEQALMNDLIVLAIVPPVTK